MGRLNGWLRRLRSVLHRAESECELDEEIRLHLEFETEKNLLAGMSPAEARRRAVLAFGGVEKYREATRAARRLPWLEEVLQDVSFTLRTLRKRPGFTVASVLTLALGTGAATAIFAAVHAVLMAPLPHPDPERLVRIYLENSEANRWGPSAVDYRAVEERQTSFSAVGTARPREVGLIAGGEPARARSAAATSGFFTALGVRLERGRAISSGDEIVGAPPVAVIGHELAARAFGGRDAVGRSAMVDGVAHTVVGVLPEGMDMLAGVRAELWTALQIPPPERRGPFGLVMVGRLRQGTSIETARHDLRAISNRIFPDWASTFQDRTAALTAIPLREATVGRSGRTLWMFAAAIGLLLLISLANVAGLVLVRATSRSREWALRSALGASRRRLVRQLVTESVALTVVGALAGLLVAATMLRLLIAIGPNIPRIGEARLDPLSFAFATALALLAGLLVGVSPVLALLRRDAALELRGGDREVGISRRAGALRGTLVVAEFALALPLLAGAALLLTSFLRLQQVDPGFDPRGVLAISVSLPTARYPEGTDIASFWTRSLSRVRDVPGVLSVGVGTAVPPDLPWNINNFDLLGRPGPSDDAQPSVPWASVSPEFFQTLRVPLLEGRIFSAIDSAGGPPVAVVSRAWERRFSPDRTALGRQFLSGGCTDCPPTTIIGIVGDVKYGGLAGSSEAVYDPLTQASWPDATLFVRTSGLPVTVLEAVRDALHSVDAGIPLDDALTLEEHVYASIAQPRHWATLIGAFAITALTLSAIGIFGMLSYVVAARRREIGVRVALGAARETLVAMIVRHGMIHAVAGAAVGLVVALLGARWIEGALFQVGANDPGTLVAVTLLMLLVALCACWLPARRAAAIDPMEVMRGD